MKTQTKARKMRCGKCKKTSGIIKFYIVPDDEKVRHYHSACWKSLKINQKKHGRTRRTTGSGSLRKGEAGKGGKRG